jgi:hypothetical protein
MTKRFIGFLVSTKTAVWLLCLLVVMLFAGAFIMPAEEAFQSVHSMPLLNWMEKQPLETTWWLWGSILLMCALAANTLFCSIDSVVKKRRVTQWLLLISPQIIHIGFLFMLLAHLFSSIGGYKTFEVAAEGRSFTMPDNSELEIKQIHISFDPYGYLADWRVDVGYLLNGRTTGEDSLMPNKPVFRKGVGVYVRDLRAFPYKMILLEISREPGAVWALIGGILFMIGTFTLLLLKIKREPWV